MQFRSPRSNPPILVPGDSLITPRMASSSPFCRIRTRRSCQAVKKENPEDNGTNEHNEKPKQIHMQKVEVGRDYGTDTEIISGLQGWEYVATNPSDQVFEGALVLPTSAKGAQGATPAGGPTDKHPSGSGGETSAGAAPPASGQNDASGASGGKGGGGKAGNSGTSPK